MEHLSDFTFVSMVNLTFCRRDSYLAHVKSGLKQDTLTALRQAPLALPTLFPDSVLKRAEDDIVSFEDKNGRSHGQYGGRKENRFHPYKQSNRQTQDQRSDKQHGNNWFISTTRAREAVDKQVFLTSGQGSADIKWQLLYKCPSVHAADLGQTDFKECKFVSAPLNRTGLQQQPKDCKLVSVSPDRTSFQRESKLLSLVNVNSVVVNPAHIIQGQPQRKGISPAIVRR